MKKILLLLLLASLVGGGSCLADEYRTLFTASSDSIHGDFQIVQDLGDGFLKADVSGLYTEKETTEYKWADVGFTVGADAFYPGISCEVGLKGLLGKAEENGSSGDVGAVAFTGRISYDFAQQLMLPGSFQVFGAIDYANEILSFQDTEDYIAFHFGLGIPIFEHASIITEYSHYDMDMTSGPGRWDFDDDEFRFGLLLKF